MPSDPSAEPTDKSLDPAQNPADTTRKSHSQRVHKSAEDDLPTPMRQSPNLTSICHREATTTDSTPQISTSLASSRAARPRGARACFPAPPRSRRKLAVSIRAWSGLNRTGADHAKRAGRL
jgi:hypothetical protein